jgi:hypothetical protein
MGQSRITGSYEHYSFISQSMDDIRRNIRSELVHYPYLNPIYNSARRADLYDITDLTQFLNLLNTLSVRIFNNELSLINLFPATIRLILTRIAPHFNLTNLDLAINPFFVFPEAGYYGLISDLPLYAYLLEPFT